MSGVFISYRRDDTAGCVGRLSESLKHSFPAIPIFHDISSIPPGADFVDCLRRELDNCSVVIAAIGPHWLDATDEHGVRRLDNPGDFVRLEIATALARPITLVPVRFGGASAPRAQDLPAPLSALAGRQCEEISDLRWNHDCMRLFTALGTSLGMNPHPLDAQPDDAGVSVGEGLVITNSRVGDISGVKVSGAGSPTVPRKITVAHGARLENVEVGDITGVKTTPSESAP